MPSSVDFVVFPKTGLLRKSNLDLAKAKTEGEEMRKRCHEAEERANAAGQGSSQAQV